MLFCVESDVVNEVVQFIVILFVFVLGLVVVKQNLFDFDCEGLECFFVEIFGEVCYCVYQVMKWIYYYYVIDFDQMIDFGKVLCVKLQKYVEVCVFNIVFDKFFVDGIYKWLLVMGIDGKNVIEVVYILDKNCGMLCVFLQVGCVLNCIFCLMVIQGFNCNLFIVEIIGQVWVVVCYLGNILYKQCCFINVVMMGMGELLMNFDNVVCVMSVMCDDLGYGLVNKCVILLIFGLVLQIDCLLVESDVLLVVLLYVLNDVLCEMLVLFNKKYLIVDLMVFCVCYLCVNKCCELVMFEYILMKGINDQFEYVCQLVWLMWQFDNVVQILYVGKVNLILFNLFLGICYECFGEMEICVFQKILFDVQVLMMVWCICGDDIDVVCGQFKGQVMDCMCCQVEFNKILLQDGKDWDVVV